MGVKTKSNFLIPAIRFHPINGFFHDLGGRSKKNAEKALIYKKFLSFSGKNQQDSRRISSGFPLVGAREQGAVEGRFT